MLNLTNSRIELYRTAPVPGETVINNSYFLKRVDDGNGMSGVDIATGASGENVVGIAHVQPLASTSRAVIDEEHTRGSNNTFTLDHMPNDPSGIRVYNETQDVKIPAQQVTLSGRTVTLDDAGSEYPESDDTILVSYRRSVSLQELNEEGLPLDFANQFNGAEGAVEFATGQSSVEVDFFDTSVAYQVNDRIYVNENGLPTSAQNGDPVGRCTISPNGEFPILGIAFDLNF